MKGVQCYELFGGIALKNHTFSSTLLSFVEISKINKLCFPPLQLDDFYLPLPLHLHELR